MNILRRILIVSHRYLGIGLSLLAIMWFATGITMMYVGGMPRLTPELRLERLPSLDLSRVRLTPSEAAEKAGGRGRAQLLTVMERPAYRIGGATVFADTGEVLEPVSRAQAKAIASRFMRVPEERITHLATLNRADQWTLGQGALPLHKFAVDDEDGTQLYVQPRSGEVTTLTTRKSRGLAWISTIPHWLYFTALRTNQPVWYRTVVWTSAAVCLLAVLGLALGFTQFRKTRPFSLSKAVPYSGWMRWHYITGVVFGLFSLTWAFSGLLSMEPFEWTNAEGLEVPRDALTGGPTDLDRFAAMAPATWDRVLGGRGIKEVEFARIQDEHYYVVRQAPLDESVAQKRERLHQPYYITGRAEQDRLLVAADTLEVRREPPSQASMVAWLRAALPDVPIVESALLSEYDSYYYSRRGQTPLPVLRVKFGDPAQTWVYVDPDMGQVLTAIPKLARIERWAYNGLHSLDFSFWYYSRAWDVGMIALLLGCLASSCMGLVMGIRRVRRGTVRVAKSLVPGTSAESGQRAAAMTATER
jgi:uncharacterized iron-regulated membrane protein